MEGKKTDELHLLSDTSSKHSAGRLTSESQFSAEENRNENPQGESPLHVAWPPPQWSFLTPDEASWPPPPKNAWKLDGLHGACPPSAFGNFSMYREGAAAPSPFGMVSILAAQFCGSSLSFNYGNRSPMIDAILSGNDFSSSSMEPLHNLWGMELTIDEFVLVRVRGQQSNTTGENDEMMPKEEAICIVCFNKFTAEDVLMTKCKCKFELIHEDCSKNRGNNCHICEEDIRYVSVTLLSDKQSFPTTQKLDANSSTAKRYWCILSKKLLRRKK